MSNQELVRFCEACGASNAPEAQFCGTCGRELQQAAPGEDSVFQGNPDANAWQAAAWIAAPNAQDAADVDDSDPGEMEEAAEGPPEGIGQKRCGWCGNLNPWVAAVCESCGARFPIPEQDEAFRRAAEERLRQEEANLDQMRRRRRPWLRLF